MKRLLSIALLTMIFASPALAQSGPTTTKGGGPDVTVQSGNSTRTVKDTTVHTTLDNGVVVSTSSGTDGKPNGGVGSGGGGTNGGSSSRPPAK
jgi:predicted S18 family serine protease